MEFNIIRIQQKSKLILGWQAPIIRPPGDVGEGGGEGGGEGEGEGETHGDFKGMGMVETITAIRTKKKKWRA